MISGIPSQLAKNSPLMSSPPSFSNSWGKSSAVSPKIPVSICSTLYSYSYSKLSPYVFERLAWLSISHQQTFRSCLFVMIYRDYISIKKVLTVLGLLKLLTSCFLSPSLMGESEEWIVCWTAERQMGSLHFFLPPFLFFLKLPLRSNVVKEGGRRHKKRAAAKKYDKFQVTKLRRFNEHLGGPFRWEK